MNPAYRIIVLGAGAIGAYYGALLSQNKQNHVLLVARGNHLKALQAHGLQIIDHVENKNFKIPVTASSEILAEWAQPDLILITVKSFDTPHAIQNIQSFLGEKTQIISLQNGLDNYVQLIQAFGSKHVMRGLAFIGAEITQPGTVEITIPGRISTGEESGKPSPRTQLIEKIFENTNIHLEISSDIQKAAWNKLVWNCVFNILCVVTGETTDQIFKNSKTHQLAYQIFEEIQTVAQAYGISLTDQDKKNVIDATQKLKAYRPSTLQDRLKGKPLEYEFFTGAVIRLAKERGIEVPIHKNLYQQLLKIK